jgi:hypothetical protein
VVAAQYNTVLPCPAKTQPDRGIGADAAQVDRRMTRGIDGSKGAEGLRQQKGRFTGVGCSAKQSAAKDGGKKQKKCAASSNDCYSLEANTGAVFKVRQFLQIEIALRVLTRK